MAMQKLYKGVLYDATRKPEGPHLSPELDKVDQKDMKMFSEMEALSSGALLEATIEKGEGPGSPQEGDLVFVHMIITDEGGKELFTTCPTGPHSAFGFLLEKSPKMPRGLEITVKGMCRGDRRALKAMPKLFFQHPDCGFHLPDELKKYEAETLSVDLRLVKWYSDEYMSDVGVDKDYVLKRVLKEGKGWENPRPPYEIRASVKFRTPSSDGVQCTGTLLHEEDSLEVAMGSKALLKGVEMALSSMVREEHSVFVLPVESLSEDTREIPFPVEGQHQIEIEIKLHTVTQVRDMYGDGRVVKRRISVGTGEFPMDCPMEDCHVTLNYKARPLHSSNLEGKDWMFDSSPLGPVDVDLGCEELPDGVEGCIKLMLPGETSIVQCDASMAYSNSIVEPPPGISKDENVEFEITLLKFDKNSVWTGVQDAEKILELGKGTKEFANQLFKQGKYKVARMRYQKVVRGLDTFRNYDNDDQMERVGEIQLACIGNIALCYTKEEDYARAVEWCNKALRIQDDSPKMLLRRGRALSLKGDFEEATADFEAVLNLDPELKDDVERAMHANKQRHRAALARQKRDFSFFS